MSRYVVAFGAEEFGFELADDQVIASWRGPAGLAANEAEAALRAAVEQPRGYPPLRQIVVPGDHVAIALDAGLSEPRRILTALIEILTGSGVESDAISVITLPGRSSEFADATVEVHNPSSRTNLAYLSTTASERRVYLNRGLIDADVVLPVGVLRYDPVLGRHGPWSVLFPGMGDVAAHEAYRRDLQEDSPTRVTPRLHLDEVFEVGWLLGTQFQIGVIPGVGGPAGFVAGLAEEVRDQGAEAVDRVWSFQPEERAEVVVAGIGVPDSPTSIDDLVAGLVTASRLVQHGGKIVALSRVKGPIGPSLQRLVAAGDSITSRGALQGFESDPDSIAGRRLSQVLAWADVYLLSDLDRDVVEDLSMIPLDRPEDAQRLAARSSSCILLSHSELTRATVRDGDAG